MLDLDNNLPKLKNCAHCGSSNVAFEEFSDYMNYRYAYIICNECGIRTCAINFWSPIRSNDALLAYGNAINELACTWNKRATDIATPKGGDK